MRDPEVIEPSVAGEAAPALQRPLSEALDAGAAGGTPPHGAVLSRALADAGAALDPAALGPVLDALLDDLAAILDVEAVVVQRADPARGVLVPHGTRGEPAPHHAEWTVALQAPGADAIGSVTCCRRAPWAPTERERRTVDALVRGAIAAADAARLAAAARRELAERQRTEDALRVADTRFRRLMEAGVIGIAVASPEGVIEANDEYLRHAGCTREDLAAGRVDWQAITPPEYLPLDFAAYDELLANGASTPFEKEYVHADGARVRILVGASLLTREPPTWVAFTLDVTARHRAETALASRVADWEALFALAPVPLLIADDPECTRMRANAAYQAMTGVAPGDNPSVGSPDGAPPYRVLHRGGPVAVDALPMQRAAATGEAVQDDDFELVFADGRRVRLASYACPRRDAAGRVVGALGAFVDITEARQREAFTRLLADVGETLASSLDYRETVRHVARLALPALADWSVVDLVEGTADDGTPVVRRVAVAHADPARQQLADRLAARAPATGEATLLREVLRTGEPRVVERVPAEQLERAALHPEQARLVEALGVGAVAVLPLRAGGRVLGVVSFVRAPGRPHFAPAEMQVLAELTSRAALAVANAALYRDAQDAARVKGEFLAVMSHELRTPLQAVLGYAGLLADGIPGPVLPAQQQQLGRIRAAANHLLTLIDEVLTLSRLEAGHERLRPAPLDARDVARGVAEMVEPSVAMKGLAMELAIPPEPVPLVADAMRLQQVLLNLLSNAVKFTERGRVGLELRRDGDEVVLAVRDTGVGIAREHLERVFESFWRAEPPTTRRTPGAGLGLAISHRLVALMGGRLTVESTPGAGSCFEVRLPAPVEHA